MLAIGVEEERLPAAFVVIDKIERAPADHSLDRLQAEVGLDEARARSTFELFDQGGQGGLDSLRGEFGDLEAVAAELERMEEYFSSLEVMGLGSFVEFDLRIVRGLAYYTGIVFEIFDRKGELRAICGGGRYDHLDKLRSCFTHRHSR